MLRVRGLRKTFPPHHRAHPPTVALDDVSFAVEHGAFAAVLGPSGSGKTTLLRCIAGFERPDEGEISLAGRTLDGPGVRSVRPYERGIGVVPQEGALFPHLTIAQNIGFGLTGTKRSAKRARVGELLELIGMPGLGQRRPHQLSGGQQQRVALARALAPEPSLVLLDEPFSALDAKLRVELRIEVRALLRRLGATAILVTHDQDEAISLADHLAVMRAGKVVAAGSPRDLYDAPPDVDTGRFLGEATVLPADARRDDQGWYATCELGSLRLRSWTGQCGPCQVLIRPEQLAATSADEGATVEETTFFGSEGLLQVRLPDSGATVLVRTPGHQRHHIGDRVALTVTQPLSAYPAG